jgi:pimeloyl-ACP methyl ester carboxylesterase
MDAAIREDSRERHDVDMTAPPRDVVVLAPGFLGFDRFGGFYYFAERAIATLRGALERAVGRCVPVVPCKTLPTDSLGARQRFLMAYLEKLCSRAAVRGVQRLHLVGHSTGGVDVQLLASTPRLDGERWTETEERVRERIASVVTISAPHHGTGLGVSPLASFGENPLRNPFALFSMARTLGDLLGFLPRELAAAMGLQVAAPNDLLRFVFQILRNRDLIIDLQPHSMAAVRARVSPDARIPLTCFVSCVPHETRRKSDPFFVDLYDMTADGSTRDDSPMVAGCRAFLERASTTQPELVIARRPAELRTIDLAINDGIVNTARQLVAPEPRQLGAIVVADHGDVLGHYDRCDALIGGKPFNAGLFHSGADFGDDQFFALYERVAAAILRTIPV